MGAVQPLHYEIVENLKELNLVYDCFTEIIFLENFR
jgi:hypothetical protein